VGLFGDGGIGKSMKIWGDAYLVRDNPELDRKVEAALDAVSSAGERGIQVLVDALYDGISLSGGSIQLKDWGDYTWNELLKKREIIRALQRGNARSSRSKLKVLLEANCRYGQWAEIVVPALRKAIEVLDVSEG
jgi:hypothetical protein